VRKSGNRARGKPEPRTHWIVIDERNASYLIQCRLKKWHAFNSVLGRIDMTMCHRQASNSLASDSSEKASHRELMLRSAERVFTAAEFSQLLEDVAEGKVDIRIYDDGIVLMRTGDSSGAQGASDRPRMRAYESAQRRPI
jgi:hypothetical protein